MSISQAGVYSLKLYENKDFEFDYDSNGLIILSSISNTGDTLELETNDNFIKYANALVPAENNTTLNDHTLAFEINGLNQSNLDIIEKLQSSIYGWIALITFMDNQVYLINIPFHPKYDKFDSQVTHTFFVELKPRIFTLEKLEEVVEAQGVAGLLDFTTGVNPYVEFDSIPDVTGSKTIRFKMYLLGSYGSAAQFFINFQDVLTDHFNMYSIGALNYLTVEVSNTSSINYTIDITELPVNEVINVELIKLTGSIISLTFNGITYPDIVDQSFSGIGGKQVGSRLGTGSYLDIAYIWDIVIDSFTADGQPDGNTDAAWSQSITATVFGSPSIIDLP